MKTTHWLIPVVISSIAAFAVWRSNERTIGYVNLEKTFNSFQMKIELQKAFDKTMLREQAVLDSLKLEAARYQTAWDANRGNAEAYDALSQSLEAAGQQERKQQIRMETLKLEFDSQIQKQLAQYLKEFGESVNADILFGVMDDGTVLYSSNGADMTNQAIEFINDRYLDK
jgi:Skp family chaperone for outer membrane proteins